MSVALEEQFVLIAQVLGAMLLGGVIGFERELVNRPAGFRTHMIVAGASALLVRLGIPLLELYAQENLGELVAADPFRTIEAVVTGIAFLGAGTILQRRGEMTVRGLTTAATLLLSGAIGIATAVNFWVTSAVLATVTVVLLKVSHRFEIWLDTKKDPKTEADDGDESSER